MLVLVEVDDRVATVTLNRPEARNAVSAELHDQLDEAITGLDAREDVGCMVLTGADPAFCAGMDMKALATEQRSAQQARQREPARRTGMMPPHRTPVIGAVNGPAVTGGLELAMCCDFLIASERARFADTHVRVGVMPGGGMTIRLPQLVGIDRARRMSLTGDYVDAATARDWGLVVEVVPHESLLDRARELARTIAAIPAEYVQELRHGYEEMSALSGHEALRAEWRWSRKWMEERFDQSRLAAERERIVARGREQSTQDAVDAQGTGGSGTPS
jgi:enoyl-CoA hydratase